MTLPSPLPIVVNQAADVLGGADVEGGGAGEDVVVLFDCQQQAKGLRF